MSQQPYLLRNRSLTLVILGSLTILLGWADPPSSSQPSSSPPSQMEPATRPAQPEQVPPTSLWSESCQSLYSDRKACKVGDVLTILVSESAIASARADTKTSKSESASVEPGVGPLLSALFPELSAGGKTASSSSGTTTRSGSLIARLSVVITEVLPGDQVRVEGIRTIQINKETQKLVIRGIVRIKDIAADNTVPSSLVANAELVFEGKGVIGSRQREGIITKLFKLLF